MAEMNDGDPKGKTDRIKNEGDPGRKHQNPGLGAPGRQANPGGKHSRPPAGRGNAGARPRGRMNNDRSGKKQ